MIDILNIQRQRITAFFLFSFLLLNGVFSQTYTLKGKLFDAENKEPLFGATVLLLCSTSEGAVCDTNGNYTIQFNHKDCEVRFQYMGYETVVKSVSFAGTKTITLDVPMKSVSNDLGGVNVKASRERIKKEESVSSVEFVKSKYISDFNITSLDNAFNQTSGLVIVNNEPQMRGGSGFSSGMGSRVMVMMDEMPVMRADAGRPAWNLIPMENIEQIEILKGAASVLYGSSATTGAINVRTTYPKGKPLTKVTLYNGFYSRPQEDYRCSWDKGTMPLTYGVSISHTRRIKKFDLVLSVEYAHDDGFVNMDTSSITATRKSPDYEKFMHDSSSFHFGSPSYQKLMKEERFRLNFGTRNQLTKNIFVGINGICLYSNNTMTHFWANADNGMYNVFPGSLSNMTDFICFFDPYFKYLGKGESSHTVKGRYMYSDNGASNNQDSRSKMAYLEYQYFNQFKKLGDMQLFAGAVAQYVRSEGNVFSGRGYNDNGAARPKFSENVAVYAQLEKKLLRKKNLTILGGGRYEYFRIYEQGISRTDTDMSKNYKEAKPVFRAGLNYQIVKTYTSIRASFGQGYRFPTIGERYITTKVGNYGFYPNPHLESETSWNVELGLQQLFKVKSLQGMFDIAVFYQRYNNYVEFFFGPWLTPEEEKSVLKRYGFKFFNTGPSQIVGIDLSTAGEAKLGKYLKTTFYFAYTYSAPKVLDTSYIFASTATFDYSYSNTSSETTNQIMKYRLEHVLKADLGFTFFDCFTIGASAQYYSRMDNIDQFFYTMDRYSSFATKPIRDTRSPFPYDGLENYRKAQDKGSAVYGFYTSFEMWNVKLSLIINNLVNKEYSLRPMCPEAPRVTTLQLMYKFTEGEPFFPKRKKTS
jgi:iron complex outermembrane receptor protein